MLIKVKHKLKIKQKKKVTLRRGKSALVFEGSVVTLYTTLYMQMGTVVMAVCYSLAPDCIARYTIKTEKVNYLTTLKSYLKSLKDPKTSARLRDFSLKNFSFSFDFILASLYRRFNCVLSLFLHENFFGIVY